MITIGIIGGGNMAEAIIHGLLSDKNATQSIFVSEPNAERRAFLTSKFPSIHITQSNKEVLDQKAEIIVLAIKPQIFSTLLPEIAPNVKGKILVSIAAGITIKTIKQSCPDAKVVRVMPNTPFLTLAGCGGIAFEAGFSVQEKQIVKTIFENSGLLLEVPEEKMHAITAISGSGPAYFFYFTEELINAGIKAGLTPEEAKTLATHTLFGAGKLLISSDDDAQTLRKKVTSPKGTTEAAINSYIHSQTGASIQKAVEAAIQRSKELAGEM